MTEWQRMTDGERTQHMQQYVGKTVRIITAEEWQKSQRPDYPRFTPRWQGHRIQEIDVSELPRGILLSGRFWMRFDEIADVQPDTPTEPHPTSYHSADADSLQEAISTAVTLLVQDAQTPEELRCGYHDSDGWAFVVAAIRVICDMGFKRQDVMRAWDEDWG